MCIFKRSKLKKCFLPKKGGIKYQHRGSIPCSILITILNMNESQTIYLTKIHSGATVLGEFCKSFFNSFVSCLDMFCQSRFVVLKRGGFVKL